MTVWESVWEYFGFTDIRHRTAKQICSEPDASYIYGWYMYADRKELQLDALKMIKRDIAIGIPYHEYRLMGYLDAKSMKWSP